MRLIRLDENSTERSIKEVLSLDVGAKFYMDPKFRPTFEALIPLDKVFNFFPIKETHIEFSKFGKNCYEIVENHKKYTLG